MTHRAPVIVAALVITASCAAALAADLPSGWRAWRYSRSIQVDNDPSAGFSSLRLPVDVFPHAQNRLADLRIIDESGAEVPYVLSAESGGVRTESRHAELRENSYVPGQYTQVLLDLGKQAAFHNAVKLATSESDFMNWAEVAASDDTRTWRIVKARAPISRFQREGLTGNQTIRYSQNNARYLRLRIFETAHQFPVTSAEVVFASEAIEPLREAVPVNLVADSSAPPSVTRWTADFHSAQYPVRNVVFETPQPEFFRAVRIQTSADAKEWSYCSSGEIYRYKVGDKLEESLRVPVYGGAESRYWRVEVLNENDAPLDSVSARLLMHARKLYFERKPGHSYRLLYGNSRAESPRYDFARIVQVTAKTSSAQPVELGPEELTANYADPRPFTERHPNLLWLVLAVAVILLAYAAMRSLKPPAAEPISQKP